ncbi:MAG: hypothetical protein IPK24_22450 [Kineosporiaceae bacterium]|nr:hypothetical protein [Kineosporiaceae bacterium]
MLTADEVNATNSAINDVVSELGANPSGTAVTVGARLDDIEADVTALGAGSIPDGSVSTAKLANGAVTAAKVAADVATQAELDALASATTAALAGKASTSHGHVVADTTGLQAALDGKAATAHAHSAADVTTGTLPLARGGTGGTDAATARTALGLGSAAVVNAGTASVRSRCWARAGCCRWLDWPRVPRMAASSFGMMARWPCPPVGRSLPVAASTAARPCCRTLGAALPRTESTGSPTTGHNTSRSWFPRRSLLIRW